MRSFTVKINGKIYNAEIEETTTNNVSTPKITPSIEPSPVAIPKVATSVATTPVASKPQGDKSGETMAPMPGTILKVCATNGASVNAGDTIIILEAMKMENEIVAAKSGTVSINVAVGQSVNTGDSLFVIS